MATDKQPQRPFYMVSKDAVRTIRKSIDSPNLVLSTIGVYAALCETLSNANGKQPFTTTHAGLGAYSGLSRRTVIDRLRMLEKLGLVSIESGALKAPCRYTLCCEATTQRSEATAQRCASNEARHLHTSEEHIEEAKEEKIPAAIAPVGCEPSKSNHTEFIRLWHEEYQKAFGDRYLFGKGKDGSAVKQLLAASRSDHTPHELIEIAKQAWMQRLNPKCFRCKSSTTITAFVSNFNAIKVELKDVGFFQTKEQNDQYEDLLTKG